MSDKKNQSPHSKKRLIGGILASLILIIVSPFVGIFADSSWLALILMICGALLMGATLLIPLLRATQEGFSETKKQQAVMQEQAPYPVVKRLNVKSLLGAFSLAMMTYISYGSWVTMKDLYYKEPRNEVFCLILLIASAFFLVIVLLRLFQKVYQLSCPICGGNIEIPVGTQACDCPLCKERLVFTKGKFCTAKEVIETQQKNS